MADQLTPYWNATTKQFEGPANLPSASQAVLRGSATPVRDHLAANQVGNAAAATIPIGIVSKPGKIVSVKSATIGVAAGAAVSTVDVKVNGTTVLTGVITHDNSGGARVALAGTLVANPYVQPGDFIEAVITAAANGGTLPTGVSVQVAVDLLPITGDAIPLGHAAKAGRLTGASVTVPVKPGGNDTYAVDILKDGVSILSAPITVDSAVTNKVAIAGTLVADKTVAAGAYFEATITYTHGTGQPASAGIVGQVNLLQN
jgi:hypothetical protein